MQTVLDILSWILLAGGSFFIIVGNIGLVRMPDMYTRMHAASLIDTLGAGLFIGGLMIQGGLTQVSIKLLLMMVFVFFASPTASYALANAALSQGLKPLVKEPADEGEGGESSNP